MGRSHPKRAGRVFFVDDAFDAYEPWTAELGFLGVATESFTTADSAFRRLWNVPLAEVALVVVDVMLTVADLADPRFTEERTNSYLETGLTLLEDLIAQNPAVFPRRAVLLSNTTSYETYRNARAMSARYDFPFWEKPEINSPLEFADLVLARIDSIDEQELT